MGVAMVVGFPSPVAPVDDREHEGPSRDVLNPGVVGLLSPSSANSCRFH